MEERIESVTGHSAGACLCFITTQSLGFLQDCFSRTIILRRLHIDERSAFRFGIWLNAVAPKPWIMPWLEER